MKGNLPRMGLRPNYDDGVRDGRQEVVDWIEAQPLTKPDDDSITQFYPFFTVDIGELKTRKKEWGLDERL